MAAPRYNLLKPYGVTEKDRRVSLSPYWVMAVVRLGEVVSYDRSKNASTSTEPGSGVQPRKGAEKTLIIDSDCVQMSITRDKRSPTKTLNAVLKRGRVNYLKQVHPGDWVLAWIVGSEADYYRLIERIEKGEACNNEADGLRFVGRVHQIRHRGRVVNRADGKKSIEFQLQAVGFEELMTQLFYDYNIATNDLLKQNVGRWLARVGVDTNKFFSANENPTVDNINVINRQLLQIFLGGGVSKALNAGSGEGLNAASGAGVEEGAPNAYLAPAEVGKLLGKKPTSSKGVLAYADLVQFVQGLQKYAGGKDDLASFVPETGDLSGTFLPFFPTLVNTPFWSVLQQYVNPTINEMYTCLRTNIDGKIVPTIVFRQIPFTTNSFNPEFTDKEPFERGEQIEYRDVKVKIPHTRFLDLPRWVLPGVMVEEFDLGRSNATRTNLVHVFGVALNQANNMTITKQLVQNAPLRDDLDIQRSGVHSYMTTVDCAVDDQVGLVASKWMRLIADWTMGSHLTMNGTLHCYGLQAPICEGDNVEISGLVLHIEGITDTCSITPDGDKEWRTILQVSNGVEAQVDDKSKPSYPGLDESNEIEIEYPAVVENMRPSKQNAPKKVL